MDLSWLWVTETREGTSMGKGAPCADSGARAASHGDTAAVSLGSLLTRVSVVLSDVSDLLAQVCSLAMGPRQGLRNDCAPQSEWYACPRPQMLRDREARPE